jgi:type IV pilus assembly protein PilA
MLVTFVPRYLLPMLQVGPHPARPWRNPARGFSLVELLVVVMIILVIAAIAVPSYVQARMKANEASAVSSMRTIRIAEMLYSQTYPDVGFSRTLADLGSRGSRCDSPSSSNACIINDDGLANGFKSGYVFEFVSDGLKPSLSYTLNGIPESTGVTGRCAFSSNEGGEISFVDANGGGVSRYTIGSGSTCDH